MADQIKKLLSEAKIRINSNFHWKYNTKPVRNNIIKDIEYLIENSTYLDHKNFTVICDSTNNSMGDIYDQHIIVDIKDNISNLSHRITI